MHVFITGATGYIGNAVARALRRAGHEVWGLCRSSEAARALGRDEIHAIEGDITRPESYARVAEECAVLVHCAADLEKGMSGPDRMVVDTMLDVARRGVRPKTLVYTSGVWVYGQTGRKLVDETTELCPLPLVAWRPEHEELIGACPEARGVVVRPGCVYGGRGGLTGSWFQGARESGATVVGDGKNRWAVVHVEDLADAYVRLVESSHSGAWNITDRSRFTVGEMAEAAARVMGHPGNVKHVLLDEARKTMGPFADALALDQHVDARKAVRLLGWQPRHGGFVDGVEAYAVAWKAHQEER